MLDPQTQQRELIAAMASKMNDAIRMIAAEFPSDNREGIERFVAQYQAAISHSPTQYFVPDEALRQYRLQRR